MVTGSKSNEINACSIGCNFAKGRAYETTLAIHRVVNLSNVNLVLQLLEQAIEVIKFQLYQNF